MKKHVLFECEIELFGVKQTHKTIDLMSYLENYSHKSKTYVIKGTLQTIRYLDKLIDIRQHNERLKRVA